MADRYPLVVASSVVQEIAAGDNLSLVGTGITGATTVGVGTIVFSGGTTITGTATTIVTQRDIDVNGILIGNGPNGTVGFSTLGAADVAMNIRLATGDTYSNFVGITTTTAGVPSVAIGHNVLRNFTGLAITGYPASYGEVTYPVYGPPSGVSTAVFGPMFGNTVIGYEAGYNLTVGAGNIVLGRVALYTSRRGVDNVAIGDACMVAAGSTTGSPGGTQEHSQFAGNCAVGSAAMYRTRTSENCAFGRSALLLNQDGYALSAFGAYALSQSTGTRNTAVGHYALYTNTSGNDNVAIGVSAGYVSVGGTSSLGNSTGSNNIFVGTNCVGPTATTSNTINLGNHNHTSLRCNVQTITGLSDGRDKTDVEQLTLGLDFVNSLSPVRFTWDRRDESILNGTQDAGFIAQDLQTVVADNSAEWLGLVSDENPDKLEASYGKLIPVLVKAIQELKAEVDALKAAK